MNTHKYRHPPSKHRTIGFIIITIIIIIGYVNNATRLHVSHVELCTQSSGAWYDLYIIIFSGYLQFQSIKSQINMDHQHVCIHSLIDYVRTVSYVCQCGRFSAKITKTLNTIMRQLFNLIQQIITFVRFACHYVCRHVVVFDILFMYHPACHPNTKHSNNSTITDHNQNHKSKHRTGIKSMQHKNDNIGSCLQCIW